MLHWKFTFPLVVLGVAIGMTIGLQYATVRLPVDFERPWLYRSMHFTMQAIGRISSVLEYFDIAKYYESHQLMTKYAFNVDHEYLKTKIKTKSYRRVGVRIYEREGQDTGLHRAMVYIHGNFRAFSSIESYDLYLYQISKKVNMKIISIDYRLPPMASFNDQLEDCVKVMEYILKHGEDLNIDFNKIIIAGDSEGGQLATSLTQRIFELKQFVPKLQVLIYSSMQMYDFLLPSSIKYKTGLVSAAGLNAGKLALWNLGIKNSTEAMNLALTSNDHTTLIRGDLSKVKKFSSHLNTLRIGTKYKEGNLDLYRTHQYVRPEIKNPIFTKEYDFEKKVKKLFSTDMSPGLVETSKLLKSPHTYFIACEMDGIKDEQLIYAERLKSVNRPVKIKYYKKAFHGMAPMVDKKWGFALSRKMMNDLIGYIHKHV